MTVPRLVPFRSALVRAFVGALAALALVTGCTTLEEKERALTFRVEKNDAEALAWFQKSADQGYAKAQLSLGQLIAFNMLAGRVAGR